MAPYVTGWLSPGGAVFFRFGTTRAMFLGSGSRSMMSRFSFASLSLACSRLSGKSPSARRFVVADYAFTQRQIHKSEFTVLLMTSQKTNIYQLCELGGEADLPKPAAGVDTFS